MSKLKPLGSPLALILLLAAALFQAVLAAEKPNVIEDAIFSETTAITRFYPGGQYVMLTFDGGPRSVSTNKILDILHDNYATATFFVQGSKAFEHPQVVKRFDMTTLPDLFYHRYPCCNEIFHDFVFTVFTIHTPYLLHVTS